MTELQIQIIRTAGCNRRLLAGRELSRIMELKRVDPTTQLGSFDEQLLESVGKRLGLVPMTESEAKLERQIQMNSKNKWHRR